jgi:hypothetical protein
MKQHLNANHLKMIAILAMTVDHIADLIYPGFPAVPAALGMHIAGRLTAPIMWFFLCEGFFYTRNLRRYMGRMLLFAVISHFAYCFAFGISCIPFRDGIFNQTSVIWPLFWALAALWVVYSENRLRVWQKWALVILIDVITFPADWSCVAVMAIVSMYENRGCFRKQMTGMMLWVTVYCVISFLFVDRVYALVQLGVILVCPLLRTYNGQKGKATWMKWFFYLYYPAHLIVVGLLRLAIYGNISLLF